jgi:hypothetical protein
MVAVEPVWAQNKQLHAATLHSSGAKYIFVQIALAVLFYHLV